MTKGAWLVFGLMWLFPGEVMRGQEGTVSGTVSDEAGTPLAGANVVVEGTEFGASTDREGTYSISAIPEGTYTVMASYIGYESSRRTVVVGREPQTVNFTLALRAVTGREVQVIGSRFARTAREQAVPVDVFTAQDIRRVGFTETAQILQALAPSFNMPRTSITDGSDTVRPMTLRGLSSGQVLVLINGKRRHTTALVHVNNSPSRGDTGVDLNAIPAAAIERIEVLRDGAAAQYGSDAIAGVINIVLKSGREGGNLNIHAGQNVHRVEPIPETFDLYDWASYGEPFEWNPTGTVVFRGRDASGKPQAFIEGSEPFIVQDGQTVQLQFTRGFRLGDDGGFLVAGEYRHRGRSNRVGFEGEPYYEYASNYWSNDEAETHRLDPASDWYVPPRRMIWGDNEMDDWGLFFNSHLPQGNRRYYAFGGYTFRHGDTGCFTRQPDQPNKVWLEATPTGYVPRIRPDVRDYSLALGMKGVLGQWSYDVSSVYGKNDYHFRMFSTNASYGPEPLRTYDIGGFWFGQWTHNADFTTRMGSVDLALGAESRWESYRIYAGEQRSYGNGRAGLNTAGWDADTTRVNSATTAAGTQCFSGFRPSNEAATRNADRSSLAGYVDAEYTLLTNLRLGGAVRFESYSDFGNTVNFKTTLRYQPGEVVVLRGAASTGFRAPALAQAFQSKVATNFLPDPQTGETVAFEVGTFPVNHPVARALGARPLKPETSVNLSAGISVQAMENFQLSADLYSIAIDDRIVLTGNFLTTGKDDTTALGSRVYELLSQNQVPGADFGGGGRFFTNAVNTKTFGFDIMAAYDLTVGRIGDIHVSLAYNNTRTRIVGDIRTPEELAEFGAELVSVAERRTITSVQPADNLNLSIEWARQPFDVVLRINRVGEYQSRFADSPSQWEDAGYPAGTGPPWQFEVDEEGNYVRVFGPKVVTDLEVGYDLGVVSLAVGGKNIFDVMPDKRVLFARVNDGAFPYPNHNPFGMNGRFLYMRMSYTF
ncbi:MAG: TonB-dependent receptor domain-containing protein [Fidelibacterota bacterium]